MRKNKLILFQGSDDDAVIAPRFLVIGHGYDHHHMVTDLLYLRSLMPQSDLIILVEKSSEHVEENHFPPHLLSAHPVAIFSINARMTDDDMSYVMISKPDKWPFSFQYGRNRQEEKRAQARMRHFLRKRMSRPQRSHFYHKGVR